MKRSGGFREMVGDSATGAGIGSVDDATDQYAIGAIGATGVEAEAEAGNKKSKSIEGGNNSSSGTDESCGSGSGSGSGGTTSKKGDAKLLIKAEERHAGVIASSVLTEFLKAQGLPLLLGSWTICILAYSAMVINDFWLAVWVKAIEDEATNAKNANMNMTTNTTTTTLGLGTITPAPVDSKWYCGIYAAISVAYLVLLLATTWGFSIACRRSSRAVHHACITRLLHAPMHWWEATPSGRIYSRFSSDLSNVDLQLANIYGVFCEFTCTCLVLAIFICVQGPLLTIVLVAGLFAYGLCVVAVDRTNREVKRMANNSMSPLQSVLAASLNGRYVIRARGAVASGWFRRRFDAALDDFNDYNFMSAAVINWVSTSANTNTSTSTSTSTSTLMQLQL
jgi:ABC-type multidrug transport system fused ATPase/permease subunit